MPNDRRALDSFIGDLAALHARFGADVDGLVAATCERLAALVRQPGILPADACIGSPDRYTQHVLHVAADRSHSVVALVWYPGQFTPIHDHVSWCMVGVHGAGSSSALIPPAENIHRVANAGAARAISIHVYGADIERLGSSINRTFEELPVREPAGTSRQAWRAR